MGNTVSAHIYEIKVFRPYPVILYRLRLDHSYPLVEKNRLGNTVLLISTKLRSLDPTLLYCIDSDWTTLSIGGKKLVSLGTTKIGHVLDGKAPVLVYMHGKIPI